MEMKRKLQWFFMYALLLFASGLATVRGNEEELESDVCLEGEPIDLEQSVKEEETLKEILREEVTESDLDP